ncbi:MAG: response regulator [Pseudanabaenaceae cyanobacterium bins.39]|nr:response regulator [Pseudanabaenaceae cyanobacterium bins.39]
MMPSAKPKLLIVDDEIDNLDLLQRIFYREYQVLRAKSGFEALSILANETDIAVIVSDQRMPMMSGTELLSQVAESYPDTLRIILTAHTDVRELVEAINQSQVFKYITKPFQVNDLVNIVRQAMETHQLLKSRTSKLKNQLESAEAKYQSIFENAIEGIFQTTIDGQYVIANPMLAKIYGYESAQHLIKNITNIAEEVYVNPNRRQECIDILYTHDTVSNFESQVYRCDGSKIWISENVRAVRDATGQIVGFEGTVQDITQRKRAEQESQLLQSLTLEISNADDFHTALEIALTKICQFTGWDYGEVWIPQLKGDRLSCSSAWYSSLEGLENFRQQSENISFPMGIGFPGRVWLSKQPEWIWDIALESEFDFFRKHEALDCGLKSGLAIPVQSNQSDSSGENDPYIVAVMVFFTRTPNDRDQRLVGVIGAIATQLGSLMRRKRDEEALRLMNDELALARDRALEASRTKSTFVANMSHELRTPLNAIIGYSEMLQEDAELLGIEEFVQDLQKIHQSGRHLLDLINDILDMTKIEAGKLEIYYDNFDVPSLIFDTTNTIQPLIAQNNNRLEIECDRQLGVIRADITRLRQVLLNLLSNACKFTKSGTIRIKVQRLTQDSEDYFTFEVSDTGIGISPENLHKLFQPFNQVDSSTTRQYGGTGLGLAISHRLCTMMGGNIQVQSSLGQGSKFTIKLPANTEKKPKSSPSIDAAVKHPIDFANQSNTDSKIGGESNSQIVSDRISQLPKFQTNPNQPANQNIDPRQPVIQPQTQNSYQSILVIDSDPMIHHFASSYLSHRGIYVYSAFNGREGIDLSLQIQPNAIILDTQLPNGSGWDVLQELKSQPLTSAIPIILLTAPDALEETGQDNIQISRFEIGANDFLFKPIDRDRLITTIDKYRHDQEQQFSILIVEDDLNVRSMLRRMLEKEHYKVYEAQDGHDALKKIVIHQPQLILLDLMMPNVDGFEFIHLLRLKRDITSIPIIIITAKDLDDRECIRLSGSVQKILQKNMYSYPQLLAEISDRLSQFGILSQN